MKIKKSQVYSLCGIFWFIMDSLWFWKLFYPALIFGGLTVSTCIVGLMIYIKKKNDEFYIVIATFFWIMLNMCFLSLDILAIEKLESLIMYFKMLGFFFTLGGIITILSLAIQSGTIERFEKFKKL